MLSELPVPMTGSIEADRHMGVTHNDGGQQYVANPSRKHCALLMGPSGRKPCI